MQELGKRVEKYALRYNLAQAPSGITFGQIYRGDAYNIRKDLQKVLTSSMKRSSLNVASEDEKGLI